MTVTVDEDHRRMENIFIQFDSPSERRMCCKHIAHYKVTSDLVFIGCSLCRRKWQPRPRIIIGQRHTHDILNCHLSFGRETDV